MEVDAMYFAWPDDSAHVEVSTFVDLEFSYMGRSMGLSRFRFRPVTTSSGSRGSDHAPAWRRLQIRCQFTGESMSHLLQHANILRLRTLLARDEHFVDRIDDQRVRTAIARLIQRGTLAVFERIDARVGGVPSPVSVPSSQPIAALPRRLLPATSFGPRTPAALATAPSRSAPLQTSSAPASVQQLPDPNRTLDQNAQAAVLVDAARDGTPFCEECARRAAERAERIAA
jgi:hypothetical protein